MGTQSGMGTLRPIGEAATLPVEALVPSPANRETRKDEDLRSLATSIKTVVLIYPLVVRPDASEEGVYRIVAGERRWRAMKLLKLESAPCLVLSAEEDEATAEVLRVVENHQRRNLSPLEEAAAVRKLLDLGLEPEAVARSLGRSRAWVARRASLTELSERWLEMVRNPDTKIASWPPSHLEVISRFPSETQDRILGEYGESWQWSVPTFHELVELTGQFLHVLSAAPWKLDDEMLCPEAGACIACPKRSSHAPDLFAGELSVENGKTPPGDRCLDPLCWSRKGRQFLSRKAEELRREHCDVVLLSNDEEDCGDLSEAFRAQVLSVTEITPSRKSDRKAVPALVVNGPGLGRVKWIRPLADEPQFSNGARDGREADTGASVEKSPEEKRKPYDKRRRQVVIDAVKAKLEALAAEDDLSKLAGIDGGQALAGKGLAMKTLVLLAALLTDRGWSSRVHEGPLALPEQFPWNELHGLQNHQLGTSDSREAALQLSWELLRLAIATLAGRLSVVPGEQTNEPHYAEAEVLCDMLGLDLAAFRAEAAKAVPYAKLWREQVEDDWAASGDQTMEAAGDSGGQTR